MALSTDKPIIAVCGATGFQGGSVVRHLLRDGRFAIRALTRKPNSAQARELANLGVAVVRADFDDLPSLCEAFKGCYGVFGVTDYFEAFDKEAQQGYNIVDAAKATGIKHLVLSTGAVVPYEIMVFTHKAATSAYLRKSGVPFTLFYTSFYYSNLSLFDAFVRDPKTGGWRLDFPFPTDVPLPSVSPRDIGAFILGAFASPSEWVGEEMKVVSEYISLRQYGEILAEVTGSSVEISETTQEQFLNMQNDSFRLQSWTAFKWFLDQHLENKPFYSVELAHRLCPDIQTFRGYAKEHVGLPPEQPMMVHYVRTQERFSEGAISSQ